MLSRRDVPGGCVAARCTSVLAQTCAILSRSEADTSSPSLPSSPQPSPGLLHPCQQLVTVVTAGWACPRRSAISSSHYSSCHPARPDPPSGPSAAGCADGSGACRRRSSRTPRAMRASQCCNTRRSVDVSNTNRALSPAGKRRCAPGVAGGDGAEGGVSDARGEERPRGIIRRHPLLHSRARCQPRQQALRPADCAERKHMKVKCREADSRRQRRPRHTAQKACASVGTSAGWEELTVLKKVLTLRTR